MPCPPPRYTLEHGAPQFLYHCPDCMVTHAGRPAPQLFSSAAGGQRQEQLAGSSSTPEASAGPSRRTPAEKNFSQAKLANFLVRHAQGHGVTYDDIMREWPDRRWSAGSKEYEDARQALLVCMGQLRKKTGDRLKLDDQDYLLQTRRSPGPNGGHVLRFIVVPAGVTL